MGSALPQERQFHKKDGTWGILVSASQKTWAFLHGHFNNYLPIPVLKQYVSSTQQNGFSNDSACMYDKKMHEAAWDHGDLGLKT